LDNFYQCQINAEGNCWPSSEHYYQASKFPGNEHHRETIRLADSGMASWHLGNTSPDEGPVCRADLEEVKVELMYRANFMKFSQNRSLGQHLTATRGPITAQGGMFWKTWNEVLLERIREELRGEDGDQKTLAQRFAAMDAYRLAAKEKDQRKMDAITKLASKRQPIPKDIGNSGAIMLTGLDKYNPILGGLYKVDCLEPEVNGQPHYVNDNGSHLYLGAKGPRKAWVLDEFYDPREAVGTAYIPVADIGSDELPSGEHPWNCFDSELKRHTESMIAVSAKA
jgi:predicted NAD-dependent protein-ADP-ribosyltransferase YbiA (DUF1768 family)